MKYMSISYKRILPYLLSGLSLVSACTDPLKEWEEINAVIPGYYSYNITMQERALPGSEGVSVLDASSMIYSIAFQDPDGADAGILAFEGPRTVLSLSGDYQALPTSSLAVGGTPVNGPVSLVQNALNSLTVKAAGEEIISFAKGTGIPEYSRPVNKNCTKKYLLAKTVPVGDTYTTILSLGAAGIEVQEGLIDLYKGNGDYLILRLNTAAEGIQPGNYKAASPESTVPGTFTIGHEVVTDWFNYPDGSQFYTLENDTQVVSALITGGEVTIAVADEELETWNLTGYLILSNGSIFDISYTGRLSKETVPGEGFSYTDEIGVVMAFDWNTWEQTPVPGLEQHIVTITDKTGSEAAKFTFVTKENASDYTGDYTVVESAAAELTMNNGWDLSAYGMGTGGSYFVNSDGTYTMLNPGDAVTVSDTKERVLTFTSGDNSITARPAGGIPDSGTIYSLSLETADVYDSSFQVVSGVKGYALTLKDGETAIAGFAFVQTEGTTQYEGTYECVEGATEPFQLMNGYDLSAFGLGIGGSYWYEGEELHLITFGTVVVIERDENDVYSFSVEGKTFKAKF